MLKLKLKYVKLFENFVSNIQMINEDNLEVKRIAKVLYSFLKKNGVREVSLSTSKLKIGKDTANDVEGRQIDNRDNTAQISYYDDPKAKQTIIEIWLWGDKNKIQEVEKLLLNSYPGLFQFDRELDSNSNSPKDKVWCLNFCVVEKTNNMLVKK